MSTNDINVNNVNNVNAKNIDTGSETEDANAAQFHLAFQRTEADIRAVHEEDLIPINIDITSVVPTVLGVIPELQQLRETIALLPIVNQRAIENLQDYGLALGHVHAMYRAASAPPDNVADLASEAQSSRENLQTDAAALAKRKFFDKERVLKLRGGNAYKHIAFDLLGLVELFLESWPRIQGKTAVELSELERARWVANRLLASIGLREQAPATINAVALLRQQAFTLLVEAYEETRRAVRLIRWHQGDWERFAPSLYAGRAGRPSEEEETVQNVEDSTQPIPAATTASATDPGQTSPGPANAAQPTTGAAAPGQTTPATANTTSASVPVGFPGASPFLANKS